MVLAFFMQTTEWQDPQMQVTLTELRNNVGRAV